MPRLSVLLPVKDGGRFLRQAIDSVLRSLPSDGELVVLNDGSSDNTADILDGYVSNRLTVHTAPSPMGISAGLNHLITHTDSEIIARMDADDVSLPWRFGRQMRLLRSSDIVFSSIAYMTTRGFIRRPDIPGPIGNEAMALHLLIASFVCHPTMMARRDALPDVPYRRVAAEDYDLWLRLIAGGKRLARDSMPSYLYREHSSQISMSEGWLKWRDRSDTSLPVLQSYQAALDEFAIGVTASRNILEFVQGGGHDLEKSDVDGLRSILGSVKERSRRLSVPERVTLGLRIRRVEGRLARQQAEIGCGGSSWGS